MQAKEIIATVKAIKKPAITQARQGLAIGKHDVDFILKVTGSLTVGKNYETKPTVAVPYKRALAALCYVSGCTGKAGVEILRKAMTIALADESDTDAKAALTEFCPMVERVEKEVIEPMLKGLPKLECKGKVTTSLTYTTVETY